MTGLEPELFNFCKKNGRVKSSDGKTFFYLGDFGRIHYILHDFKAYNCTQCAANYIYVYTVYIYIYLGH